MKNITPMIGAALGVANTGKSKKSAKAAKAKPVAEAIPMHPMLGSATSPPPSDKKMAKENAKYAARRATEDWVSGHMTTKEVGAVHARAKHVLSGKAPMEFKGPSGERKMKGLR